MGHTNTTVTQAWAARFHQAAQMGCGSEGLVPQLGRLYHRLCVVNALQSIRKRMTLVSYIYSHFKIAGIIFDEEKEKIPRG